MIPERNGLTYIHAYHSTLSCSLRSTQAGEFPDHLLKTANCMPMIMEY